MEKYRFVVTLLLVLLSRYVWICKGVELFDALLNSIQTNIVPLLLDLVILKDGARWPVMLITLGQERTCTTCGPAMVFFFFLVCFCHKHDVIELL